MSVMPSLVRHHSRFHFSLAKSNRRADKVRAVRQVHSLPGMERSAAILTPTPMNSLALHPDARQLAAVGDAPGLCATPAPLRSPCLARLVPPEFRLRADHT